MRNGEPEKGGHIPRRKDGEPAPSSGAFSLSEAL